MFPASSFPKLDDLSLDERVLVFRSICTKYGVDIITRKQPITKNDLKRKPQVQFLYINATSEYFPRSIVIPEQDDKCTIVKDSTGKIELIPLDFIYPSFLPEILISTTQYVIKYFWNPVYSMFSAGNITEKERIANFDCEDEVIVDLYAGIGYFVLPYLIHAKAKYVHACEWNTYAVAALKKNLVANKVDKKCSVYEGDNKDALKYFENCANRVNLGLLPTSKDGYEIAIKALNQNGGWLHVHENVAVEDVKQFGETVVLELTNLLKSHKSACNYALNIEHTEIVKNYAPKVVHVVYDIKINKE
ncbi:hypothetical protein ROZALSC1DRAFT_23332 [Rozella allomycis CSF55]|uniref:tRNA(Phe) (4-demethylwyosine(37)-C(7)) aminocarboxypropyltransferase n=1 Tax=Rozella allomycis (strain CSF55) TaxID=988480 RepID=A0A4P9YFV4_ROZAC|nr:hypothetical protein ROZALSC1DRAFT_23332 [Rozella allomycis CSF55]